MKAHALLLLPLLAIPLACSEPKFEAKVQPMNESVLVPLGIRHISFSPKGKWLVAGGGSLPEKIMRPYGGDGFVKVWDVATWKLVDSCNEGFTDPVEAIFFVTEDSFAVTTNKTIRESRGSPSDGTLLRSWSVPEKKELPSLQLKSSLTAFGIDFYSPSKLIADSWGATLVSFPDLQKKVVLEGYEGGSAGLLRFSPDGKRVLACKRLVSGLGIVLRTHDTADGKRIAAYRLDEENERYARFSPNGKMIAIATESIPMREDFGKIHVFSADLSAILFTVDLGHMSSFATFTPDSENLVNAEGHDYVELHSVKSKEVVKAFKGNPEGAHCCCFSPNGSLIAIGCGGASWDGKVWPAKVRVFEFKTGKLVAQLE